MKRTRTGCLTCRQRKLKCSEERPNCAPCLKSHRECVFPSSNITFRHEQNPSMNGNQQTLKSFYGYKETFAEAAQWMPVSKDLTWVHTSNPYNDDDDYDRERQRAIEAEARRNHTPSEIDTNGLSHADYSAFTEGLAALSAIASRDQHNFDLSSATVDHRSTMQNPQSSSTSQPLASNLDQSSRTGPTENQLDPQLQMLDARAPHQSAHVNAQASPFPRDTGP